MLQNYIKYNAETASKSTQDCSPLLCYRFVSTALTAQIPNGNAIANLLGLLHTGKERDSETGFSYFGARYYDSDILTGWLSVDPLADKYPNISPYAYCGWNPIRLVDPDGNRPIPLYNNYNGWYVKLDSRFGLRNPQIKKASRFHKGIDLNYSCGGNNDLGSPILKESNYCGKCCGSRCHSYSRPRIFRNTVQKTRGKF